MRLLAILFVGLVLAAAGTAHSRAAPAGPAGPLPGLTGAWRVVTLDGAPPPGRTGVTMDFAPGGRLSGQAPCNRYHAGYRIEGNRIIFSPGATTRMFCGEEIMSAEQRLMEMLGGGAEWSLSDENLTLAADSGVTVTATRTHAR